MGAIPDRPQERANPACRVGWESYQVPKAEAFLGTRNRTGAVQESLHVVSTTLLTIIVRPNMGTLS